MFSGGAERVHSEQMGSYISTKLILGILEYPSNLSNPQFYCPLKS